MIQHLRDGERKTFRVTSVLHSEIKTSMDYTKLVSKTENRDGERQEQEGEESYDE